MLKSKGLVKHLARVHDARVGTAFVALGEVLQGPLHGIISISGTNSRRCKIQETRATLSHTHQKSKVATVS